MKRMLIILHGEPRGLNIAPVIEPNVLDVLLDKNSEIRKSFGHVDLYWNIPDGDIEGTIREVVDKNGNVVSIDSILSNKDIEKNINQYVSKFGHVIDNSIINWRTNSLHRYDSYYTDALKYGYENYTHILITRPDIKLQEMKHSDYIEQWGPRFDNWVADINLCNTDSKIYIQASDIDIKNDIHANGHIGYEGIVVKRNYEIMFANATSLKFLHDNISSINSNIDYHIRKDSVNKYSDQRFNIGEMFWQPILRTFVMAIGTLHMMPFIALIRDTNVDND